MTINLINVMIITATITVSAITTYAAMCIAVEYWDKLRTHYRHRKMIKERNSHNGTD